MSLRKLGLFLLFLLFSCAAFAQSINGVPNQTVTGVPASSLGSQSANTMLANTTSGSAAPSADAIPAGIQNYVTSTGYNQATTHQIQAPLICADTSGSGTAQSCTTSPTFVPAANDCVIYTTTTANTGALTLNVDSSAADAVQKWLGTAVASGDVPANHPQLACLDGSSHWQLSTIGNAPAGSSLSFPLTVSGTTTSGGIPYLSSTTQLSSSGLLAANAIVVGGGAGTTPATDSSATLSTGTLSLGASGTLGAVVLGNATSGTLTVEPATGAITSYTMALPVAQPAGSNTFLSCTAANPAVCTWAAAGGGSFPTGSTGNGVYFSGTNTGASTAAIFYGGATAGSDIGVNQASPIQQLEVSGPIQHDAPGTGTVTFNGSCSGTATSCTIAGGTALNAGGGVVLASWSNGSNNQEYICYSAATSTTLTIGGGNCQTPVTTNGRSYWASTASAHSSGDQLVQVIDVTVASDTATPSHIELGNNGTSGGNTSCYGGCVATIFGNSAGNYYNNATYFLNNPAIALLQNPSVSNGATIRYGSGALQWYNSSANQAFTTSANALDYSIATQTIATTATLTALTNVTTPSMNANSTAAAAGTGGVQSSLCHVIWSQATGGTVSFAVHNSAAVTRLDVTEVDYDGSGGVVASSFVQQGLTTTGTQAAIGTVTPSAFGTVYHSDFTLTLNPGTTNSDTVQLYAESSSSSDTLSVYAGSGCGPWQ